MKNIENCRLLVVGPNVGGEVYSFFQRYADARSLALGDLKVRQTEWPKLTRKMVPYTTDDINEACYYINLGYTDYGFKIRKMMVRKYSEKRRICQEQWKFYFTHVPLRYQRLWAQCKARVNLREFFDTRFEVKRKIWESKSGNHVNSFMKHI